MHSSLFCAVIIPKCLSFDNAMHSAESDYNDKGSPLSPFSSSVSSQAHMTLSCENVERVSLTGGPHKWWGVTNDGHLVISHHIVIFIWSPPVSL